MVTNLFDDVLAGEELFNIDCDVLIPAAIANQITEENAENIKADIICEAANGPTTKEATQILTDKGVLIVPDVLASAGGVTVSYFEWVQNNQGYYWDEDEVNEKLEIKLKKHSMRFMTASRCVWMMVPSRCSPVTVRGSCCPLHVDDLEIKVSST